MTAPTILMAYRLSTRPSRQPVLPAALVPSSPRAPLSRLIALPLPGPPNDRQTALLTLLPCIRPYVQEISVGSLTASTTKRPAPIAIPSPIPRCPARFISVVTSAGENTSGQVQSIVTEVIQPG